MVHASEVLDQEGVKVLALSATQFLVVVHQAMLHYDRELGPALAVEKKLDQTGQKSIGQRASQGARKYDLCAQQREDALVSKASRSLDHAPYQRRVAPTLEDVDRF